MATAAKKVPSFKERFQDKIAVVGRDGSLIGANGAVHGASIVASAPPPRQAPPAPLSTHSSVGGGDRTTPKMGRRSTPQEAPHAPIPTQHTPHSFDNDGYDYGHDHGHGHGYDDSDNQSDECEGYHPSNISSHHRRRTPQIMDAPAEQTSTFAAPKAGRPSARDLQAMEAALYERNQAPMYTYANANANANTNAQGQVSFPMQAQRHAGAVDMGYADNHGIQNVQRPMQVPMQMLMQIPKREPEKSSVHNSQNVQRPMQVSMQMQMQMQIPKREPEKSSVRPRVNPSPTQKKPVVESAPRKRQDPSPRRPSSVGDGDEYLYTARSDSSGRGQAQGKARANVEYKPITLDEFKEKYPEYRRKYVELGRLGPDLTSEELLQKKANAEKMKDYSKHLRTLAQPLTEEEKKKLEEKKERAKQEKAQGRQKAAEYAEKVREQRQRALAERQKRREMNRSSSEPALSENGLGDDYVDEEEQRLMSQLEELQLKHKQYQANVRGIKSEYS